MSFLLVWIILFIWLRLRSSSHYEEWINRQVILTATSNTDLFHLKIACKRIFLTPRCEETIKAFLTVATVIANIVLLVISFLSSQTLSCHVISILGLITNIVLMCSLLENDVKVDLSTVGSLLDDTNARNWRDALLQVWMICQKIDNQSFPFLYGAPQP